MYCIVFAQFMCGFGFSSFIPFLPLYVKDLGATGPFDIELLMGLVFSGQAFTMMLASPIWGLLADRYGKKLMVERAMFGGAGIVFLMAYARSAENLVVLRMAQGAITGVISANSALLAAKVPRERIGYAMGLLQVALGAGIGLGPFIGGILADLFGYRFAFFITSLMLFLAGIIVLVGVKEQPYPPKTIPKNKSWFFQEWWFILSSPKVPTVYLMRFLCQLERMTIMPVLPLFVLSMQATIPVPVNAFTGIVVSVWSVSSSLTAGCLGRIGDRIGHIKVLVVCSLAIGLIYVIQSFSDSGIRLMCLQAAVGGALGGIIPSISALLSQNIPSGSEGTAFGLDNSVTSLSWTIAPLISAYCISVYGFPSAFLATGAIFFIIALVGYHLANQNR